MAACNIVRDDRNRILFVEAPNGQESILFNNLNDRFLDNEEALRVWLVSKTKDFKQAVTFPKGLAHRNRLITSLQGIQPKLNNINLIVGKKDKKVNLDNISTEVAKTSNLTTLNIFAPNVENMNDKVKLGRIRFKESEFEIEVDSSLLMDLDVYNKGTLSNLKGIGLGTKMYAEVAQYALRQNKKLVSSDKLSGDSRGVWDKLTRLGIAETTESGFQINNMSQEFDENGEPNMASVLNFVDKKGVNTELSEEEIVELKDLMLGLPVTSSTDLLNTLRLGFMPNGYFSPSRQSLNNTNLYKTEEITDILSDENLQQNIRAFIYKLQEVDTIVENDVYVDDAYLVVQDGSKNKIGKFILANPYTVEKRAIDKLGGIETRRQFEEAMFEDDLSTIVANPYLERQNTKEDLFYKYKAFRNAAVLTLEENQLTPKLNNTRETLEEVLTEPETGNLENNLDFLINLENSVWEEAPESVNKLLDVIEKDLLDIGLDTVNLKENSRGKDIGEIKEFLSSVETFLNREDDDSFDRMINAYNDFFNVNDEVQYKKVLLPSNIKSTNTFYLQTDMSQARLFADHGLIPVGRNVYKRVLKSKSIDELMESVYKDTMLRGYTNVFPDEAVSPTGFDENGQLDLSRVKDPANKRAIIEDMKAYVQGKTSEIFLGDEVVSQEDLQKYVIFFNYYNRSSDFNKFNPAPKMNKEYAIFTEGISNQDYLQSDFIADFNKKILKEKAKNSKAYQDFYSNFEINSNGIFMVNKDPISMNKAKLYLQDNKDLVSYMKLHKQGVNFEEAIVQDPIRDDLFFRNYYVNFPQVLKPFKGDYTAISKNTIHAKTKAPFIRTPKGVYELLEAVGRVGIYGKLQVNPSNYKRYSMSLTPPSLDVDAGKLRDLEANVTSPTQVTNLYSDKEGEQIDKTHDNC